MARRGFLTASYGGLAALVAGPLLGSGLLLAVDAAPVPRPQLDPSYWGLGQGTHEGTLSRLPLDALLAGIGWLTSVAVAQKLVLVLAVALAGWGMHRLVDARHPAARAFAGLLYAVNPFVYERIWTGQLYIVLGYALLPWAFAALRRLLRGEPSPVWPFVAFALATGIASSHMAVLLALLSVCCLLAVRIGGRRRSQRQPHFRPALAACGLAALASAWWLLPTPGVSALWSHVGRAQLAMYASIGAPHFGLIATLAALSGFWNDTVPAIAYVPAWPALALTLVVLAGGGLWLARRDAVAWAVAAAGVVGFVLALGYAWGPTRAPFAWLLAHFAPLRSFRESGKGLALVAFAYAYLGAAAVDDLLVHAGRRFRARAVLATILLAVPLALGSRELWADWGRLHPSRYPTAWAQADAYLAGAGEGSRTLVLPFHGYFGLSFAHGRVVANPAPAYFRPPVLAGRSVGGPEDQSDPEQARVQALLSTPVSSRDFASCLAALGVQRILVLHQADWASYGDLARRPGISLEQRWPGVTLYRSARPASLVMAHTAPAAGCAGWTPVGAVRSGHLGVKLLAAAPTGARLRVELPDSGGWQRAGARSFTYAGWNAYRRNYEIGAVLLLLVALIPLMRRLWPLGGRRRRGAREGARRPVVTTTG